MRRYSKALVALLLGVLLVAAAGRLWIGSRIEAASARTAICLKPDERARFESRRKPADQRDLLVIKAAQFAAPDARTSHVGSSLDDIAIDLGFRTLWTARRRAAVFRRIFPTLRTCPA